MLNLRLFHGRDTPDERLTDWGFEGPLLGPLSSVNMTYGEITLYPASDDVPPTLQMVNGLVAYENCFYGDMEITCGRERGVRPREEHAVVNPSLLARREEAPSIRLPKAALKGYRARVAVFIDSIRELAGDEAARAAERALSRVVMASTR
jgi:hypothetical protein